MRVLNQHEANEWCRERGITFNTTGPSSFGDASERYLTRLPESVILQDEFIRMAIEKFKNEGFLVYLRDWNVFSKESGIVQILQGFRATTGDGRTLKEAPGHLFDKFERELGIGLIRIVAAFGWGAGIFDGSKHRAIWDICDDHLFLTTDGREMGKEVVSSFAATGTQLRPFRAGQMPTIKPGT